MNGPSNRPLIIPTPGSIVPKADPPTGALLEAYKKHADELKGIEDRQNNLMLLLLGIFSAAGTLLSKSGVSPAQKIYFTIVAVAVLGIGYYANVELHKLRTAVRDLLVRCEIALGFFREDLFLSGDKLYTDYELAYATRGRWMRRRYWIVLLVGAGFLVLLWRIPHLGSHYPDGV